MMVPTWLCAGTLRIPNPAVRMLFAVALYGTPEQDEHGIILKLQVADDDKGRVIGKQGRIAEAMRTLVRVKAAKSGTRATLEII